MAAKAGECSSFVSERANFGAFPGVRVLKDLYMLNAFSRVGNPTVTSVIYGAEKHCYSSMWDKNRPA
jgi:hypothetical protein